MALCVRMVSLEGRKYAQLSYLITTLLSCRWSHLARVKQWAWNEQRCSSCQFKLVLTCVHSTIIIKKSTCPIDDGSALIPPTTLSGIISKLLYKLLRRDSIKYYLLLLSLFSFIQLSFVWLYPVFRPAKRSINAPSLELGLSPCCRMSALPDWSESTRTFRADTKAGFSLDGVFNWLRAKPILSRLLAPVKDHGRHVHTEGES